MKSRFFSRIAAIGSLLALAGSSCPCYACSSFMLKKGDVLVFGHNLNQPGIDVPGLIMINKRNTFKIGRTWSELYTRNRENPSGYAWISRYGSVTFNVFGRDFPDGGMNETGLFIWEMNEEAGYPQSDSLPRLMHMNWMQYILDNASTLDEALACASAFVIDGWGWHYFMADGQGRCASVAFIDGKAVVHRDASMPVPGLFNTPYGREMELLRRFKGFGGFYEPDLHDPEVPRFVKTAVMVRDYDVSRNPVEYGLQMLENLTVTETPKWSVLFDVRGGQVYFKTERNPSVKHFSWRDCDFSNAAPVAMMDINQTEPGEVSRRFRVYSTEAMAGFLGDIPLPGDFFTGGGLTQAEFVERFAVHHEDALSPERQFFAGIWRTPVEAGSGKPECAAWELELRCDGDAVHGWISRSDSTVSRAPVDHLGLAGDRLEFTFRALPERRIVEAQTRIQGNRLEIHLSGPETDFGRFVLRRAEKGSR